jgi:hypothetical protein
MLDTGAGAHFLNLAAPDDGTVAHVTRPNQQ